MAAAPGPVLLALKGGKPVMPIPLDTGKPGPLVIGRSDDCDVILNNPAVSRRHCQVSLDASGVVTLCPLGKAPVRVNGVEIAGPTQVQNGDVIAVDQLGKPAKEFRVNLAKQSRRKGKENTPRRGKRSQSSPGPRPPLAVNDAGNAGPLAAAEPDVPDSPDAGGPARTTPLSRRVSGPILKPSPPPVSGTVSRSRAKRQRDASLDPPPASAPPAPRPATTVPSPDDAPPAKKRVSWAPRTYIHTIPNRANRTSRALGDVDITLSQAMPPPSPAGSPVGSPKARGAEAKATPRKGAAGAAAKKEKTPPKSDKKAPPAAKSPAAARRGAKTPSPAPAKAAQPRKSPRASPAPPSAPRTGGRAPRQTPNTSGGVLPRAAEIDAADLAGRLLDLGGTVDGAAEVVVEVHVPDPSQTAGGVSQRSAPRTTPRGRATPGSVQHSSLAAPATGGSVSVRLPASLFGGGTADAQRSAARPRRGASPGAVPAKVAAKTPEWQNMVIKVPAWAVELARKRRVEARGPGGVRTGTPASAVGVSPGEFTVRAVTVGSASTRGTPVAGSSANGSISFNLSLSSIGASGRRSSRPSGGPARLFPTPPPGVLEASEGTPQLTFGRQARSTALPFCGLTPPGAGTSSGVFMPPGESFQRSPSLALCQDPPAERQAPAPVPAVVELPGEAFRSPAPAQGRRSSRSPPKQQGGVSPASPLPLAGGMELTVSPGLFSRSGEALVGIAAPQNTPVLGPSGGGGSAEDQGGEFTLVLPRELFELERDEDVVVQIPAELIAAQGGGRDDGDGDGDGGEEEPVVDDEPVAAETYGADDSGSESEEEEAEPEADAMDVDDAEGAALCGDGGGAGAGTVLYSEGTVRALRRVARREATRANAAARTAKRATTRLAKVAQKYATAKAMIKTLRSQLRSAVAEDVDEPSEDADEPCEDAAAVVEAPAAPVAPEVDGAGRGVVVVRQGRRTSAAAPSAAVRTGACVVVRQTRSRSRSQGGTVGTATPASARGMRAGAGAVVHAKEQQHATVEKPGSRGAAAGTPASVSRNGRSMFATPERAGAEDGAAGEEAVASARPALRSRSPPARSARTATPSDTPASPGLALTPRRSASKSARRLSAAAEDAAMDVDGAEGAEGGVAALADSSGDDDVCFVCEASEDGDELLLCDGCENAAHLGCAGLKRVPRGEWYCQPCKQRRRKEAAAKAAATRKARAGGAKK
ncbi:unnamed protein product [Pedinophyceae sp. YPF-701]|nr:unnamed protein product [Pedinophyceae sp. YPF-701]